ncbi:unnamed protein product [Dracunculus medinensis]|uniref:BHLH domain-containing protein n=1 Tax=Dracunculus medinensis TaxID=318479 RepID=A0A0N4UFL6_DRAME|nr:unnamed protein product [Dracunculus medinensis]
MNRYGAEFSDMDYNRKRNLDRRRESSRYAARDRRGKEADIFMLLREVIPLVDEATVTHVDRIALLRVASILCRLKKCIAKCLKPSQTIEEGCLWNETTLLECLDGFLAIIGSDGIILYISESVSIYLGLTQTDLTGRSLKDFVHANDYDEFNRCYLDGNNNNNNNDALICLRMKSVISPRGRNLNLKSALYKVFINELIFDQISQIRSMNDSFFESKNIE